MERDAWNDPTKPPTAATDLGDGAWVSWGTSLNRGDEPLVWHWCTGAVMLAEPGDHIEGWYPRWAPAGVGAHTLVQKEPFTISPSVYWPYCCGMHGFITDGVYRPC